MTRTRILGLAAVIMAVPAVAWSAWNAARPLELPLPAGATEARLDIHGVPSTVSDSAVAFAIHQAGFRMARTLAANHYESIEPGAAPAPAPPKPSLALVGLVLGRTSTLLLTGVPGSSGARLLSQGDTTGGLTVRSISRGRVTITGYDTVWTFRPPEEPQ